MRLFGKKKRNVLKKRWWVEKEKMLWRKVERWSYHGGGVTV
jgi:hypothetical protein